MMDWLTFETDNATRAHSPVIATEFLPSALNDPLLPVLRTVYIESLREYYKQILHQLSIGAGQTLDDFLNTTFNKMQEEMLAKTCRCVILRFTTDTVIKTTPTGVVGLMTVKDEEDGCVYIAQLAIDPAYKRRGYGRQLLQHLRVIYPQGTTYHGLCRRANTPAIQFYLKAGAILIDSEPLAKKYRYNPEIYTALEFKDTRLKSVLLSRKRALRSKMSF